MIDFLRTNCLGTFSNGRNIYWVHCLLPVASAGLWQVATPSAATLSTPEGARLSTRNPHSRFCVPLVRAQLHAISLATDLTYLKPAFIHRLQETSLNNTTSESGFHNQVVLLTVLFFYSTIHINSLKSPSRSKHDKISAFHLVNYNFELFSPRRLETHHHIQHQRTWPQ